MASCTLEIGGRIVVSAEGGPFDAEYALFEAHEIELRSNNEPGTVREHGYRTTAELARERLEMNGITRALAEAAAGELGALASSYALGPEVRRVASLLTAAELFEGRVWHAATRAYEGAWLDVAALAVDAGVDGAARALQELYLGMLLSEAPPESTVYLSTTDYTAGRRPGERTYRRVSIASAGAMPEAIRALADKHVARTVREGGPSRGDLLENVRARLAGGVLESSRSALDAIERALSVRDRPQRGPLLDPDLWALELQLADGDTTDALEKLDALERLRGRQPGTAYLRARVAHLLESEDPKQLAERVSALALSMNAFPELELLAAEAWQRAGDRKRALAYAHNLAESPQTDAAIRARARAILKPTRESVPAVARPPSVVPPFTPVPPPQGSPPSAEHGAPSPSSGSRPPPRSESSPVIVPITAGLRGSVPPGRSSAPPISVNEDDLEEHPIAPTPIVSVGVEALRRASEPPPATLESLTDVRRAASPRDLSSSAILAAQRASQSAMRAPSLPPAEAPAPPLSQPRGFVAAPAPVPSERPPVTEVRPSGPAPWAPEDEGGDDDEPREVLARGGSQPPFRTEPPPPHFPSAPIVPPLAPDRVERAETLSLPPGLEAAEAPSEPPTTPLEARVYFTHQARELGRLYRTRYNVELRTELRSIELVQRYLAERFETAELLTGEDITEVQLHGAFLSEILARRLGAEWTDLAVSEMGYWAMNVPPDTTVWPIGRVIRFVTMQHRERDLVSYFLELQARAHGLK